MQKTALIFLSPHDPTDVLNWSGTLYALYKALENYDPNVVLHPIHGGWPDTVAKQLNRLLYFIGLKFDCRHSTLFAICAGLAVSFRLLSLPNGPIVAVVASNYVPYLLTKRRIIYITDVPFRAGAKVYDIKGLPKWLLRQFDRNEGRTLRRAHAIILPSKWASDSAKHDYGVDPSKISELPFGANIPNELINEYYSPKTITKSQVNLLFVSADWERKGGTKAIQICRALQKRGIVARLVIVGDSPKDIQQFDFVDIRGFLRKSDAVQLRNVCRAYNESHFFLLPTRADASPIVFSECRAFGVPPITHLVGGAASAITHGHTGLTLPIDASPDQFAYELIPYILDNSKYEKLSRECRDWYLENAQWSNWSKLILKLAGLTDASR